MAINLDIIGQELEPTIYNWTWKGVQQVPGTIMDA